jgi:ribosomal peptide maturation radical SAM protein 1
MNFRAKTQKRALEEILHLTARYPVQQIAAVDNIMDLQYFKELLPELKRRKLKLHLFYEVKANMTKEQVKLLSEAGVTMIQPGIESLHQKMLTLMRKGVSPLQNVQLMKWCKQYGVTPSWNLLYGFPGESAREYEEMLPLIESLFHLPPPDGYGPIRLDRFSPYFMNPASFGLVNTRPMKVYRYIYPFPETELADIAYFYDYQHGDGLNPETYISPTLDKLEEWSRVRDGGQSELTMRAQEGAGALVINDTRPNAVRPQTALHGWQKEVYEFCDQVRPLSAIRRHIAECSKDDAADGVAEAEVPEAEVREFLNRLVSQKIMARDGEQYLSLAIPAPPVAATPVIPGFPYPAASGWAAATT